MYLTITINITSSAFSNKKYGYEPEHEISRLLKAYAYRITSQVDADLNQDLIDSNGNKVGLIKVVAGPKSGGIGG